MAIYNPRGELSPGAKEASTLTFRLPSMREVHFCGLSHPVCSTSLWQPSKLITSRKEKPRHPPSFSGTLIGQMRSSINWQCSKSSFPPSLHGWLMSMLLLQPHPQRSIFERFFYLSKQSLGLSPNLLRSKASSISGV